MMADPANASPTSWLWPDPPRSNRFAAVVTEVHDLAADGRRVAVIEGAVWPPLGTSIVVHEDADHLRRGSVEKVELVLLDGRPAVVRVEARLERDVR